MRGYRFGPTAEPREGPGRGGAFPPLRRWAPPRSMGLLALIGRMLFLRRLLGMRRGGRYRYGARYPRRARGRGGFFGPVPYYSRRTRGGSRVTVGGCCLPIPLGLLTALALVLRTFTRR